MNGISQTAFESIKMTPIAMTAGHAYVFSRLTYRGYHTHQTAQVGIKNDLPETGYAIHEINGKDTDEGAANDIGRVMH